MVDYVSNSNTAKEKLGAKPAPKDKPELVITQVTTQPAITKKRGLGRKFKDTFIDADAKSTVSYVFMQVVVPAAKNMLVDATTGAIERLVYGEDRRPSRGGYSTGARYSYSRPVDRPGRGASTRPGRDSGRQSTRNDRDDLILRSQEEAEAVIDQMNDILDTYDVVTVANLNEMVGLPIAPVDHSWGWEY